MEQVLSILRIIADGARDIAERVTTFIDNVLRILLELVLGWLNWAFGQLGTLAGVNFIGTVMFIVLVWVIVRPLLFRGRERQPWFWEKWEVVQTVRTFFMTVFGWASHLLFGFLIAGLVAYLLLIPLATMLWSLVTRVTELIPGI